jgi:hypothetical protein
VKLCHVISFGFKEIFNFALRALNEFCYLLFGIIGKLILKAFTYIKDCRKAIYAVEEFFVVT